MTYSLFQSLFLAAQKETRDEFLAHWLPLALATSFELESIHDMANGGCRAIRAFADLSQTAFSASYNVPRRSLQNWEADVNSAPAYVTMMLAYAVLSDQK